MSSKRSSFTKKLKMNLASGKSGHVLKPEEKPGFVLKEINISMPPTQRHLLSETDNTGELIEYYFPTGYGNTWVSGEYNGSDKIGNSYLENIPYVLYYDRKPRPPQSVNTSFRSKTRKNMYKGGTRFKRRCKKKRAMLKQ